ncbi:acyltransferase family protein [Bacillus badius]|uniref:Arginine/ornithine antiporter ArcD n=1 Tax=Bacillus badius TaxID=1455 RepID=A0ABR5B1A9_BACBA|nr:acyltransferase family protein [Bacillus badius]KIL80386.1 Arginine/ornithine antiporter ArcD [Bacillus badius]MED4718679.1 acyltransferase family protein [Bacillus badius]
MSKRDYYFDNAKFILIVFVVFGHFIRSYIGDNPVIFALYTTIYLFHMPGFILVSGFFAKGFYKKGYVKKTAQKILLPFFIFQVIYSFFYFYLYEDEALHLDLLVPHWSLWFLLSLFFWNLLLVISVKWLKLKPAVLITVSFAIGTAIGCIDAQLDILSIARTFIFFPFFLIGYYLKKEHFNLLGHKTVRLSLLVGALAVFLIALSFPEFDQRWLLGSFSFADLESSNTTGMLYRTGIYVVSFMMIATFFAFVPKKKFFFTDWGRNTLYVYLLHGFVIKTFRESEVKDSAESIFLLLIVSLFLTMFLSSTVVTTVAQPFIETRWSKLKKIFSSKYEQGNI